MPHTATIIKQSNIIPYLDYISDISATAYLCFTAHEIISPIDQSQTTNMRSLGTIALFSLATYATAVIAANKLRELSPAGPNHRM